MTTTTATQRPPEFDARVMAHLPMLEKLARIYCHANDREEAVQETIAMALDKWHQFRPEGSFHKWLRFKFLGILSNRRAKRREFTIADDHPLYTAMQSEPRQEEVTYACQVYDAIPDNRRRVMDHIAIGNQNKEAATIAGISRQRCHQLVEDARAKIAHLRDGV